MKKYYLILGLALLLGLGGSMFTPLGWDARVGNISAGLTVGVLVALYVLRVSELRSKESNRASHLEFHSIQIESRSAGSVNSDPAVTDETPVETAEPEAEPATDNILPFTTSDVEEEIVEPVPVATQRAEGICACICDCKWKSKDSFSELCGNCRRWWQQQTLRCECPEPIACSCGTVKHQPAELADIGLAA